MGEKPNQLGSFLRNGRLAKDLSLRAVEDATGISNAYLSQLEGGKIQKPSPAILYKLCELYGTSYITAMAMTGYPVPNETFPSEQQHSFAARLGPTTEEEEDALIDYLEFLR